MSLSVERGAAVRGALLITGSTYAAYVLSLFSGAIVARELGPTVYGQYAYVAWLAGWLVIAVNHGFNTTGIRFIAESLGRGSPDTARDIHGWLARRQRASLAIVLLAFVAISWWSKPEAWQGALLLFICVVTISVVSRSAYLFGISMAKGHGAFHVEALSMCVVSAASLIGVASLAAFDAPLTAYLGLFAATGAGQWFFAAMMLRRAQIRPRHGVLDPLLVDAIKRHLMWTVVLVAAVELGSKSVETFLLNGFVGSAEVGFFTIAATLTRSGTDLLVIGLNTVLMPAMGRAFGAGGTVRVQVIFYESLSFFLFFGLLLAGAGALWSNAAITLLYGAQYAPVIPALQAMVIVGGFTLSEAAFGSLLSTTGRQSTLAKISVLSLVLSGIFAVILVPRFGLSGAIVSYSVSKLIAFAALALSVFRAPEVALPTRALSRILTAACIAAGIAVPIPWLAPGVATNILAGILYVVVLAILTVLLKAWNRTQVEMMLAVSNRLPSAFGALRLPLEIWRDRFTH